MSLSKIDTGNKTNLQWRTVIDALNDSVMQENTTISITQTGNESTTQAVVTGSVTGTYNAADYSNNATNTIQAAINSIPKNLNNGILYINFGDDGSGSAQTVDIASTINIEDFIGGTVNITTNKVSDRTATSNSKHNRVKLTSGSSLNVISVTDCDFVQLVGLAIENNSSSSNPRIGVHVARTKFFDFYYSNVVGQSTSSSNPFYGVYIQQGTGGRVREAYFSNHYVAVFAGNNALVNIYTMYVGNTTPAYTAQAHRAIILGSDQNVFTGSTAKYAANVGGLVTADDGLILDNTFLTANKTVNIAAGTSVSDIQTLVNQQPKNLNGYDLTFQFADDTYNFGTTQVSFTGFEGGTLTVQGDPNDTLATNGTGLGVIIQSQNTGDNGAFFFQRCRNVVVNRIRFEQTGSNTDTVLVRFFYNTYGRVLFSAFTNVNGSQVNRAVYYHESRGLVRDSKFNNFNNNINVIQNSVVSSRNNATFVGGADSDKSIRCESGSIATQSGTQAGGTASKNDGGVIFSTTGTLV